MIVIPSIQLSFSKKKSYALKTIHTHFCSLYLAASLMLKISMLLLDKPIAPLISSNPKVCCCRYASTCAVMLDHLSHFHYTLSLSFSLTKCQLRLTIKQMRDEFTINTSKSCRWIRYVSTKTYCLEMPSKC